MMAMAMAMAMAVAVAVAVAAMAMLQESATLGPPLRAEFAAAAAAVALDSPGTGEER
jgi:hypothetical protein